MKHDETCYKCPPAYSVTEVWDFESGESEIIEPTLYRNRYRLGIALFAVDPYFCNI